VKIPLLSLVAAAHLAAAAYAQQRIPRYTAGRWRVMFTRAVLLIVGIGVGCVSASYVSDPLVASLAFVIGFGAVHVPAAVILFIKHERGAAKS
jgi:hypothetical protein